MDHPRSSPPAGENVGLHDARLRGRAARPTWLIVRALLVVTLHVRPRRTDVRQDGPGIPLYRHIAERYDSDHLTVLLNNRKATEGLLAHESHGQTDAIRGHDHRELPAADIAHGRARRVFPLGEHAHDDVAVRQDTEQAVGVQNDDVADIVLAHGPGSIHDRLARGHAAGVRGHDVSDAVIHGLPPQFNLDSAPSATT